MTRVGLIPLCNGIVICNVMKNFYRSHGRPSVHREFGCWGTLLMIPLPLVPSYAWSREHGYHSQSFILRILIYCLWNMMNQWTSTFVFEQVEYDVMNVSALMSLWFILFDISKEWLLQYNRLLSLNKSNMKLWMFHY